MSLNTNIAQQGILLSGIKARTLYTKEHWEIHEGQAFCAFVENESMGDGDKLQLAFKTPAAGEIHIYPDFKSKTAAHFSVIEGGNWSGGQSSGDVVTIFNRNRQNQNSSTLLINHVTGLWYANSGQIMTDLTGAGGGTTIFQSFAFAAKNQTAQLTRGRNEIVLNTGTQYIFELEADAGTSAGQIELEWYEET